MAQRPYDTFTALHRTRRPAARVGAASPSRIAQARKTRVTEKTTDKGRDAAEQTPDGDQ